MARGEAMDVDFDQATLARAVRASEALLIRFTAGFDEHTKTRQAPGLPNHAAWTLGHLAMTVHRAADRVAGYERDEPLPQTDFVTGDGTAGDPSRYDTETVCFGSTPQAEPGMYPRWPRCLEIYREANARLVGEVSGALDERLSRAVRWGDSSVVVGDLVGRMVFHGGVHAGQLIDLRRALGFERVVG
ncbi:MAG: DinB family protein [Planctomycetota bacterium]